MGCEELCCSRSWVELRQRVRKMRRRVRMVVWFKFLRVKFLLRRAI